MSLGHLWLGGYHGEWAPPRAACVQRIILGAHFIQFIGELVAGHVPDLGLCVLALQKILIINDDDPDFEVLSVCQLPYLSASHMIFTYSLQ